MHTTRKPDDLAPRLKKLDLRKETLRRLDSLSDDDLRRAVGGRKKGEYPSSGTTNSDDTGTCG